MSNLDMELFGDMPGRVSEDTQRLKIDAVFSAFSDARLRQPYDPDHNPDSAVDLWASRFGQVPADLLLKAAGEWITHHDEWPTLSQFLDIVNETRREMQRAEREGQEAPDTVTCPECGDGSGWVDVTPEGQITHTTIPCQTCMPGRYEFWRVHRNEKHIAGGGCAECKPGGWKRKAS